jgi:amino acid transporter
MSSSVVARDEGVSKGLKAGALGLVATTVIAIASTAPGYSLAAGIGGIAGTAGVKAPFVMLLAFVPMGCIAAAFFYMNKADADCGTNFTWGVRAFGPSIGWISGWGCIIADLVIMPNLAGISGQYLMLLLKPSLADNIWLTTFLGVLFIIAMCWICFTGIELSARSQVLLLGTELVILAVFSIVAMAKAFAGNGVSKIADFTSVDAAGNEVVDPNHVYHSVKPSLSWLTPSGITSTAIAAGLVVAVFAYWGWDTAVSVNEESTDANRTPGIAAVLSTVLLLLIYLITSFGTVALLGPDFVTQNSDDAIYAVGQVALPTIMVKLLVIAVLTSAAASCQTTILPATRTMLSMGSHGAAPDGLAHIDSKHLTPDYSTWVFGIGSILWYVALVVISHNSNVDAYSSSIAAVGLAISVYYGLSGFSSVWYYRKHLFNTPKNALLMFFLPMLGSVMLTWVFVKTLVDAENEVRFFGTGLLVLGIPLMLWCRAKYPAFFRIKPDPAELVNDPYGDGGPAAPLGTYRKGA